MDESIESHVIFTPYLYDLTDKLTMYQAQIGNIQYLKISDKIGFDEEGNLYINKGWSGQGIMRWYYNQNREKSLEKTLDVFELYHAFVRTFLEQMSNPPSYQKGYDEYVDFAELIQEFNSKLVGGFDILIETYKDDTKYCKSLVNIRNRIKSCNIIISCKL